MIEQADGGFSGRKQSPTHIPAVEQIVQGALVPVVRVEIAGEKGVAEQLDTAVNKAWDAAKNEITAKPFAVEHMPRNPEAQGGGNGGCRGRRVVGAQDRPRQQR
jgi:hypothetical protein